MIGRGSRYSRDLSWKDLNCTETKAAAIVRLSHHREHDYCSDWSPFPHGPWMSLGTRGTRHDDVVCFICRWKPTGRGVIITLRPHHTWWPDWRKQPKCSRCDDTLQKALIMLLKATMADSRLNGLNCDGHDDPPAWWLSGSWHDDFGKAWISYGATWICWL